MKKNFVVPLPHFVKTTKIQTKTKKKISPISLIRPIRLIGLIFLGTAAAFLILREPPGVRALSWPASMAGFAKRKQLTLVNNSGATLNSGATYQLNINTSGLNPAVRPDCADVRIVYHASSTTSTELARAYALASTASSCRDSTATILTFPLQAAISNSGTDSNYYLYWGSPGATYSSATALSAYNMGSATATFAAPFNGTTTALASGTGVPTTATGAIRYAGGKSALSFDGVSNGDYVTLTSGVIVTVNKITMEAWIYPKSITANKGIFGRAFGANGGASLYLANSEIYLSITDNVGTNRSYNYTSGITANNWYHVAAVFTGTKVEIFVNGTSVGSTDVSFDISNWSTSYLTLIGKGPDNDGVFNGYIDEVRISNSARYTSNFTPSTSPFIRDSNTKLLLHFDENGDPSASSGRAYDDSGNANHGTITGAKYVGGLVGVDASSAESGYQSAQSYAAHGGVFIEEGTTNKITNPSFDHSTYNTNWDAVGANLTALENSTAPYYKFGSKSLKLIANASAIAGTSNMDTIGIDPNSTASHTLSFYVYDGTTGNVGGTISSSIIKPIWEGVAQSGGTYTDMGGGWWRVTYATTTTDSSNEYGVEVQASKTVYIDGLQLEEKAYATTYVDGSLGTGYAWTGTANESTSTRTASDLKYSTTSNINTNTGTISFWVKPKDVSSYNVAHKLISINGGEGASGIGVFTQAGNFRYSYPGSAPWAGVSGTENTWYHVTLTWNTTGSSIIYYNNGVAVSTQTNFSTPTLGSIIGVGVNPTGSDAQGNSIISDLRIYSSALTSNQVGDLYNVGLASHSEASTVQTAFGDGEAPIGAWSFDEGVGTTAYDRSGNSNHGVLGTGTSSPAWQTEDMCLSGKCLKYDGNDYVGIGQHLTDVKTVGFWIKPNSTTGGLINLSSSAYISVSSGTVSATGFTSPTIYINGQTGTTLTNNNWQFVEITTGTGITADAVTIGKANNTYTSGFIDEVRIYDYARSAAQVKTDYNARGSLKGAEAVLSATTSNSEALSEGLVGYWKMDESSWAGAAGEVIDASGNSNNGTAVGGATTAAGKFGNGGTFDGTGDYATVTDADSLDFGTGNFTTAFWINQSSFTAGNKYAYDKGYYMAGVNGHGSQTGSDGKIMFKVSEGTALIDSLTANTAFSTGTWYHVVEVYNKTTLKQQIFINGSLDNTGTIINTASTNLNNSRNLMLASWTGGGLLMTGKLDDFRIYSRALSPAEVRALYNWAPGPVAHWSFDEGSGALAQDKSGNGYTGTITGATWTNGKYGKGLNFAATNKVAATLSQPNGLAQNLTYEAWIRLNDLSGSTQNNHYTIVRKENPHFTFLYRGGASSLAVYYGTFFQGNSVTWTAKTWYHVAFTYDGSTQQYNFYRDGINIGSGTVALGTYSASTSIHNLGYYADGEGMRGQMDDVRVYRYARTPDQIKEDMLGDHVAVTAAGGAASTAIGGGRPAAPLAYYKFNEGYGTTANNSGSVGSTLNGTLTSMSSPATATSGWTNSGKLGKGLVFDGSNDYVIMNASSIFSPTNVSVSTWFKTTTAAGSVLLRNRGLGYGLEIGNYVSGADAGKITFWIYDATSTLYKATSTTTYNDNNWHLATGVYNGSTVNLYVDGKSVASAAAGTISYSGNVLGIGRDADYASGYFSGQLDDVKIYNYALSEDEVKLDYNQGSALVLGSLGNLSTLSNNAAGQTYCVPGDTASCASPVAEWNFDEGAGTLAQDSSGNANTGTLGVGSSAPTWISGKQGKGLRFDGSDIVNVEYGNSLNISSQITISAWINPSAMSDDYDGVVSKMSNYAILMTSANKLYFWGGGDTWSGLAGNAVIPQNTWTFVTVTYDGNDKKIFVNGVLDGSQNLPGGIVTGGANFWIGHHNGAYFSGRIDNVRVFNYARTPAQIAWDYNQGKPMAHYKMDECSGITIHSSNENPSAGSGLDATLTNATAGTCDDGTGTTAWSAGKDGKYNASLKFDGSDDYINVSSFSPTLTSGSFSFWVKLSSLPSTNARLLSKAWGTDEIYLQQSTGKVVVAGSFVVGDDLTSSVNLPVGQWKHILITADSSGSKLYIDGKLDDTGGAADFSLDAFKIGGQFTAFWENVPGQLDEVEIFNYALTPLQIRNLYNQDSAVRFGPTSGNP